MKKKVNRSCPICGFQQDAEILKNIHLGELGNSKLPNSYDVVSCKKCGFCYADTTATMADYDDYYKNCNIYSESPSKISEKESGFDVAKDIMNIELTYESNLIDIGSGFGDFEFKAQKEGYKKLIAIDPSIHSVNKLKKYNIDARVGNVYDEPDDQLKNTMDAVFFMAVLEHMLFPQKAIEQIAKYLKPEGKLFIWIPDYGNLHKNLTQQPNNFNYEHINYFSKQSLNNLLSLYGFEEIFSTTKPSSNNSFQEYQLLCVYAFTNKKMTIERDELTQKSICEYFNIQSREEKERLKKINHIQKMNEEIIIWGTGAFVMNLLVNTSLNKCNIIAYVDNNPLKIGENFQGKKIISPTKLKNMSNTILIASMLYAEDIQNQIKDMKLKNKVIILR